MAVYIVQQQIVSQQYLLPGQSMNIRISARIRPFSEKQLLKQSNSIVKLKDNIITLTHPEDSQKIYNLKLDYSFCTQNQPNTLHLHKSNQNHNHFVGEYQHQTLQIPTHHDMQKQLTYYFINHGDCCLLLYGATGTGKTFTLIGDNSNPGIIHQIYHVIHNTQKQDSQLFLSMFDLYHQELTDLLSKKDQYDRLKIRQNVKGYTTIQNLVKERIGSYEELCQLIKRGLNKRMIYYTSMSNLSSRAALLCILHFKPPGSQKANTCYFVDMMGSQYNLVSDSQKQQYVQIQKINRSLTCFRNVIKSLSVSQSSQKKVHIPYRDSKLTFILQHALGGECMTFCIGTVWGLSCFYESNLQTMRVLERMRSIKNKCSSSLGIALKEKQLQKQQELQGMQKITDSCNQICSVVIEGMVRDNKVREKKIDFQQQK